MPTIIEPGTLKYAHLLNKVGAATGGIGDILYAIPFMHIVGIKRLYVKDINYHPPQGSTFTALRPILALQGIEAMPTPGQIMGEHGQYVPLGFCQWVPGLEFDYDLDEPRHMGGYRGNVHIIQQIFHNAGLEAPKHWWKPWLKGIPVSEGEYSLVYLSPRWRQGSKVDWRAVYATIPRPVYFVGFREDHQAFEREIGRIDHFPTADLLELAKLIAGCRALYCNQGPAEVLAQGLGKDYYLEQKPFKVNTIMPLNSHEHIL